MRRRTCLLALFGLDAWLEPSLADPLSVALEINAASRAELESLPGLGPALVERILLARQQALFQDWQDLRTRVRGLGPNSLLKLSEQGLRVAGQTFALPPDQAASASSIKQAR
ncbi:ComEA family DNA-binding protein [Paucibacter sp. Y2R2-4]|uniref:ComEA family DNA-binding protein n=1 Tax=Paucibacter sp. Y2R2-4 TaxID=2893553 RepID=UPI0021E3EDDA|nr:helix-hairpin-helix domain-containing protein [Paucibacter sp. Y2R2-4]MCV2348732.1 helix-hairpin-helix domain-containing protein [Paucibacter sp. Y2R2-4]